jgi:hypothetical protein
VAGNPKRSCLATDFAALQHLGSNSGSHAQTQTASPIAQDLQQLGHELKSGTPQRYSKATQKFFRTFSPKFPT